MTDSEDRSAAGDTEPSRRSMGVAPHSGDDSDAPSGRPRSRATSDMARRVLDMVADEIVRRLKRRFPDGPLPGNRRRQRGDGSTVPGWRSEAKQVSPASGRNIILLKAFRRRRERS
ncbi:hypothetical protein RHODGE_RHODGE_02782 [Rhodoplanes serenus]|uniref:Uncharacterized protein n=2 Tax=Nitrobacteraceae TaxID=41294 RepID=A0A3S4DG95_9BRAD|nr:hypothetical protein RHODGE_RHODGE_02782 [Rhodoplanes serenus]